MENRYPTADEILDYVRDTASKYPATFAYELALGLLNREAQIKEQEAQIERMTVVLRTLEKCMEDGITSVVGDEYRLLCEMLMLIRSLYDDSTK